jgi:hypothetical protein
MIEDERPEPQVRSCIFCGEPIENIVAVTDASMPFAIAHPECAWPEDGRTPEE